MSTCTATKTINEFDEPCWVFAGIDQDGEECPLGHASLDREGTGFDGYFDTKHVAFDTIEQLQAWGKRHGYEIEEA